MEHTRADVRPAAGDPGLPHGSQGCSGNALMDGEHPVLGGQAAGSRAVLLH